MRRDDWKVVLTKPWVPRRQGTLVILPLASLYLGSFLKKHQPGMSVEVVDPDLGEFPGEDAFVAALLRARPAVVGVTVFSHVLPVAKRLASKLKRADPGLIVVGGGSHINAVRGRAFAQLPEFDYFIHGEGEVGFEQLVAGLRRGGADESRIPGLIYRKNGRVECNPNAYCETLDQFDPIDYGLIRLANYFQGSPMGLFHRGRNVLQLITTRGCPFPCTFCASPVNMGRKVRKRSTANILRDILALQAAGADEIHIMDDNFTFSKTHVLDLCAAIREKNLRLHFALPNGVRLDKLDDEMLSAMKAAGFYHMGFGIEVGSDAALKKIKKNLTYETIRQKIDLVKRHGLGTTGFFILGFPFETEADLWETLRAPDRLGLDLASFGNFTPLPGTEVYGELVASGEIPPDYQPSFASGKVTYSPRAISPGRLAALHRRIVWHYYLNPRRIFFILGRLHWKDFKYVLRRLYQIFVRPQAAA